MFPSFLKTFRSMTEKNPAACSTYYLAVSSYVLSFKLRLSFESSLKNLYCWIYHQPSLPFSGRRWCSMSWETSSRTPLLSSDKSVSTV